MLAFQLNYIPNAWKTAEVMMILKPGKNLSEVESYRPTALLPFLSKIFGKLIFKHLKPISVEKHLEPKHQFGFRKNSLDNRPCESYTDII
jgi:hypothetical protein